MPYALKLEILQSLTSTPATSVPLFATQFDLARGPPAALLERQRVFTAGVSASLMTVRTPHNCSKKGER